MPIALRISAYITFIIGLGMLARIIDPVPIWGNIHAVFAIATVVLAFVVFGPLLRRGIGKGLPAWFLLIPLALGLWIWTRNYPLPYEAITGIHGLLGLIAIGLMEMGLGKMRRGEA